MVEEWSTEHYSYLVNKPVDGDDVGVWQRNG